MSSYFRDLQNKCRKRQLTPCSGSDINVTFLEDLLKGNSWYYQWISSGYLWTWSWALYCQGFMLRVSPEETIIPLIVSTWQDLPEFFNYYLYEVPVNSLSISSLRDERTAKILYDRQHGTELEIHPEKFLQWVKEGSIGFVLWALQHPTIDPSMNDNESLKQTITKEYVDILELLLKDDRVIIYDSLFFLKTVLDTNNPIIFKILLESEKIDPTINNSVILQFNHVVKR